MRHTISSAAVTYRANTATGREVEIQLAISPASATPADAWARLTAVHADLDPKSLEIEIRH